MSADKENRESDQAELQSVASPRISSTGAGGSEDPSGSVRHTPPSARPFPQGYDPHDMHHWGGMGQRHPHDTRSIASSAAADRDDKSIYDMEPGALDAHTEGEEEEHDDDDDERDDDDGEEEEEEPQEINLAQVQDNMRSMRLRSESSNVESTYNAMSGPGSFADVVDQLADQAVSGELSPRQAAAAIRSATRQQRASGGGDGAGPEDVGAGAVEGGSPSASAAATAAFTADGMSTDGSDSVSVSGAAHSSHSIEASQDGWHTGGMGSAAHGAAAGAGHSEGGGAGGSSSGGADLLMESIPLGGAEEEESAAPAAQAAGVQHEAKEEEQPAAAAEEQEVVVETKLQEQPAVEAVEEEVEEEQLPQAAVAPTVAADSAAAEQQALPVEPAAAAEEAEVAAVPASPAAATAPAEPVPRTTSNANYKSQLMQQLTDSPSEEDDLVVYSAADASQPTTAAAVRQEPPVAARTLSNGAAAAAAAAAAGAGERSAAAAAERPSRMEPLSVENAAPAGVINGHPTMSDADTAAALAAINAAGGASQAAPGGSDPQQQQQQAGLLFPPAWYETFKGLLYMDGVDALGRPVVVLNADAVPADMKSSALVFVKAHLEPLVNQGDYVLVFTSRGATKLPSMWIMGAYRSLPRPFRKHVQYIVLVRPSTFLRTVLAFMRPFVSKKAGRKIKQVQSVHDISEATEGEVTVQSLGSAFNADLAADYVAAEAAREDPSP